MAENDQLYGVCIPIRAILIFHCDAEGAPSMSIVPLGSSFTLPFLRSIHIQANFVMHQ